MKKNDDKEIRYYPEEYKAIDNIDYGKFSEDEIELARNEVASQSKRVRSLGILSVIWTFISTVYAVASTCVLLSRRWVESTVSYVLIGILVLYVGIFIGVVSMAVADPKSAKKPLKGLKTALKFLKPIMSLVLVALSITQVVAVAGDAFTLAKLPFMIFTMLVALIQIVFRVLLLVARARAKKIARGYNVRMARYVNGKLKRKSLANRIKENRYKDD